MTRRSTRRVADELGALAPGPRDQGVRHVPGPVADREDPVAALGLGGYPLFPQERHQVVVEEGLEGLAQEARFRVDLLEVLLQGPHVGDVGPALAGDPQLAGGFLHLLQEQDPGPQHRRPAGREQPAGPARSRPRPRGPPARPAPSGREAPAPSGTGGSRSGTPGGSSRSSGRAGPPAPSGASRARGWRAPGTSPVRSARQWRVVITTRPRRGSCSSAAGSGPSPPARS